MLSKSTLALPTLLNCALPSLRDTLTPLLLPHSVDLRAQLDSTSKLSKRLVRARELVQTDELVEILIKLEARHRSLID